MIVCACVLYKTLVLFSSAIDSNIIISHSEAVVKIHWECMSNGGNSNCWNSILNHVLRPICFTRHRVRYIDKRGCRHLHKKIAHNITTKRNETNNNSVRTGNTVKLHQPMNDPSIIYKPWDEPLAAAGKLADLSFCNGQHCCSETQLVDQCAIAGILSREVEYN